MVRAETTLVIAMSISAEVRDRRILLICGSTREGSSNSLALRKLHQLEQPGLSTENYDGLLAVPAFVPDLDPVPGAVRDLLTRIADAHAVVFSTPEYAGGLPGALKNLLDWTVGGGELYQKPVAWLDVANPGRGDGARSQLRTVLGYVGARIVEPACLHLDLDRASTAATDAEARQLSAAGAALIAAINESTDDQHIAG
jgi:NAD(P)H-dependent FMN reductase